MKKKDLIVLINSTAIILNSILVGVEFAWDGGKDGAYYICDHKNLLGEDLNSINHILDDLTDEVRKFQSENDWQEALSILCS